MSTARPESAPVAICDRRRGTSSTLESPKTSGPELRLDEVMGSEPAGRGDRRERGRPRSVGRVRVPLARRLARAPEEHDMPTKADADSAQMQRKTAVDRRDPRRLDDADAAVLTEYRGLTVDRPRRTCAPRCARPRPTTRSSRTPSPAGPRSDAGLAELVEQLEGPVAIAFVRQDGGDAVTAAKALRDFAKTQPEPRREGRHARRRAARRRKRHRGPRRRRRPATCCSPGSPAASRPRSSKAAGLFQAFTRNFAYGLKASSTSVAPSEARETAAAGARARAAEPEPSAPSRRGRADRSPSPRRRARAEPRRPRRRAETEEQEQANRWQP